MNVIPLTHGNKQAARSQHQAAQARCETSAEGKAMPSNETTQETKKVRWGVLGTQSPEARSHRAQMAGLASGQARREDAAMREALARLKTVEAAS